MFSQTNKRRIPWNKGKKTGRFTQSHKDRISFALKGKKKSVKHKQAIKKARKGIILSQETKEKISLAKKGKTAWNKGKVNLNMRGEKNPNWKGGITPINIKIRHSLEYKLWRKAVFERDNYTCIWCNRKGGKLNADHIKPFAFYPELRFAIDNGRTLCVECHKKTDNYFYKGLRNIYGI